MRVNRISQISHYPDAKCRGRELRSSENTRSHNSYTNLTTGYKLCSSQRWWSSKEGMAVEVL